MRWPLTLWRAMTFDLLRLTLITAGVLVCVVAFAATMKYLVDGRLEPGDALRFMLLTIPPMLAHALPFAGGFAATLVYHRMGTDNEMLAANAGGIGLRSMLVPAIVSALVLGGTLLYLNEQAIPRFLREMQRLITLEAPRMLTNEIQRGRAVKLGNLTVYADDALRSETRGKDWSPDVRDHVSLRGMVAFEVDAEGRVVREFFAERADLWFMSEQANRQAGMQDGVSMMLVRLKNAMSASPADGMTKAGFKDEVTYPWSVPQVLRDNPKYLSYSELRALRRVPEGIDEVESKRRGLAYAMAQEAGATEIAAALAKAGSVGLLDARGSPVVLRSAGLDRRAAGWFLRPSSSGDIELEMVRPTSQGGAQQRTIAIAREAMLRLEASGSAVGGRLSIGIDMIDVRTRLTSGNGNDRVGGENAKATYRELSLPSRPEQRFVALGSFDLLDAATRVNPPVDSPIATSDRVLRKSIAKLMNRVTAKQHERSAIAVACFLMVLIGALAALQHQESQPLTVYLWSFIPALACLVTISGGQQTVVEVGAPGLFLLWGGIAALVAYAVRAYGEVSKH